MFVHSPSLNISVSEIKILPDGLTGKKVGWVVDGEDFYGTVLYHYLAATGPTYDVGTGLVFGIISAGGYFYEILARRCRVVQEETE